VPSRCAQPSFSAWFSFRTIFRKSKVFMGGICTLAFEKQDWDFVAFLVCTDVLIYIICSGNLFCFLFLLHWLEYWTVSLG
jgi:hypothetical protein